MLVHDAQGHPRLASTSRGDQHLTVGLPKALAGSEQAGGKTAHARLIVDRDQMAAPFLRDRAFAGYTIVTLLKTKQYEGLASFTDVGAFVPLTGGLARGRSSAKWPQPTSRFPYPIKKTRCSRCRWPSSVTFVGRFPLRHWKKTRMTIRACPRGGGRTGKPSQRK